MSDKNGEIRHSNGSGMPCNCEKARGPMLWALAGLAVTAAYFLVARPRHLRWGTTSKEAEGYLPGDSLLTDGVTMATHAITIDASVLDVWPWLAQIGQDKGGFYSYTMLENLVGCHMHNARDVHPEWQNVGQGDVIRFHPKYPPAPVEMLETGRHLVIGANLGKPNASTWAFILRDLGNGRTRLIVRLRARHHKGVVRAADLLIGEPAHFVMERKMMLTIKRLAEDRARIRPEVAA